MTQAIPQPDPSATESRSSLGVDASSTPNRLGRLLNDNWRFKFAEVVLVFVVAATTIVVGQPLAGEGPIASQIPVILANALMLLTVWIGLRVRGQRLSHFGFNIGLPSPKRSLVLIGKSLLTLLFALTAFVFGAILMANIVGIPQAADMSEYNPMAGNLKLLLLSLPAVWFFASFGEEVIYRGFLIVRTSELATSVRPWFSILLAALCFGVAHYSWGLAGIVQTTFMGLALGYAYMKVGRNLWVTVLAHGVMDTVLFLQMYLQVPKNL